jgi:cytochrome c biogenesis protein CcdA
MDKIFSFWKITSLAFADSVNPCVFAVLGMMLFTILIQNPSDRKKILFSGLSFVGAVYVGYLVYGLVIIQFFKFFAEFLRENSIYIFNGLAIFAMILGALNIKDAIFYRAGGFGTEMPLFMRPKVKKVIGRVTNPKNAFLIGFLVTLFLLPCTIGPYIVASGLLSELGLWPAFFWLMYYNLIFILPMIFITVIIYYSFVKIGDVTGWKDRNIRILHLIAGILLFLVGLALLLGWI